MVAAVYAPALRHGFVWDDTALIWRDPFIRSWRLIPEGFNHFLFTDATASNWLLFLSALTFARTWDRKDQPTFFQRTIANGGDSARMLINPGSLDLHEGHLDAAKP
jgi:hypothetical protein